MKRKFYPVLFCLLTVAAGITLFLACGETTDPVEPHTHVYEEWTLDETYHWHACAECGETDAKVKHSLGTDKICTGCGVSIGLKYTFSANNKTCKVSGLGTCDSGKIVIPNKFNGVPVTDIGNVFANNNAVESVTIPDHVTAIGERAFYGCGWLNEVKIGKSVATVADDAFDRISYLRSFTVSKDNANFADYEGVLYNKELTRIIAVPIAMTSCKLPATLKDIKNDTFSGCAFLFEVDFPEELQTIGDRAFYECDNLSEINIPDSVTSIGEQAFYGCSDIKTVTIGSELASIGSEAFESTPSMESFTVASGNKYFSSHYKVLYNKAKTQIVNVPQGLVSFIAFPSTLKTIGNNAFEQRRKLISITIPEGITSIGDHAFANCEALNSASLPKSLTSIGESAFLECKWLKEINIPAKVASIGDEAFNGTTNLKKINVAEDNAKYSSIDGALYNKEQTEILHVPYSFASELKLPNTVKSITEKAMFRGNLSSILIPASVLTIEKNAFEALFYLQRIEVAADNPNYSSYDRILYNKAQTEIIFVPNYISDTVTLSDKLISIGQRAFSQRDSLTRIVIPASVKNIDYRAFVICEDLTRVYYGGTAADWNSIKIEKDNDPLRYATRYYYSETEPTSAGRYWHYVNGKINVWSTD